jgi:hypothetical protein
MSGIDSLHCLPPEKQGLSVNPEHTDMSVSKQLLDAYGPRQPSDPGGSLTKGNHQLVLVGIR